MFDPKPIVRLAILCSHLFRYWFPLDIDSDFSPSGKVMLLPKVDCRSYSQELIHFEDILDECVANIDSLLYDNEFINYLRDYPDNFT
ncbi:hypothetical protein IEQ34_016326 [Dendrobium chrysotoxum]|uniref:Uncharacterized protein n=1 Tax=Dendrobium chrysotoxum TaxID=161865 RepID=A0AAV7GF12_DENCH|nr:hypothetical protein IEQ34_016326 [Dendrobium chrysotoxum]